MDSDHTNPPQKKKLPKFRKRKLPPKPPEIATGSYRGDDRREGQNPEGPKANGVKSAVKFDARGTAIWEWQTQTPQRRKHDEALDLLDLNSLSLADDQPKKAPAAPENDYLSYNSGHTIRSKR